MLSRTKLKFYLRVGTVPWPRDYYTRFFPTNWAVWGTCLSQNVRPFLRPSESCWKAIESGRWAGSWATRLLWAARRVRPGEPCKNRRHGRAMQAADVADERGSRGLRSNFPALGWKLRRFRPSPGTASGGPRIFSGTRALRWVAEWTKMN